MAGFFDMKPTPLGKNIRNGIVKKEVKVSRRPFLRWAGGKQQIVKKLFKFLPEDIAQRHYREPFAGAASLFFALQPKRASLSDANNHLIQAYKWVVKDWRLVARYLRDLVREDSEENYYRVREKYNRAGSSAAQAARFIYLNKTCFNGIFRVNNKGLFNVPYGRKESPAIPTRQDLQKISGILRKARMSRLDFQVALKEAKAGDFIYLDPPYPPLNGTAYFTHYTAERFNVLNQKQLAKAYKKLHRKGCLAMMTNANTKFIRELYKEFRQIRLPVTRFITCKARRYRVGELVILNY